LEWTAEANAVLVERTKRAPFISQISFSRDLKKKAERQARLKGLKVVTADIVSEVP